MAKRPWLYLYDGKLNGVGIDLVAEQQLLALSQAGIACAIVARGQLARPALRNHTWSFPPTKLFSWLPSQDYYALNKRFFSSLGRCYLACRPYSGVIAWSKAALRPFEAAAKQGLPRLLNVGNFHCDYDAGGKIAPRHWPRIDKIRLRSEYALASTILVASEFAAQTFSSQGVCTDKIKVIHRGVDVKSFKPASDRPRRPFVVASCGTLGERKGTPALLEAWRSLGLKEAELWLIGTVPESENAALQALASHNVRFLGFRRDLPQLLPRAHAHVLLSRNEGLAKVLLEAAASGVANVCTVETGIPPDAPGALMVRDRNDAFEVAAVLERLYMDEDLTHQLGIEGRRWVEQNFTWGHFQARFLEAVRG